MDGFINSALDFLLRAVITSRGWGLPREIIVNGFLALAFRTGTETDYNEAEESIGNSKKIVEIRLVLVWTYDHV